MDEAFARLQLRLKTSVEGLKRHIARTNDPGELLLPTREIKLVVDKSICETTQVLEAVRTREGVHKGEISQLKEELEKLRDSYNRKQSVIDILQSSLDETQVDTGLSGRLDELARNLEQLQEQVIQMRDTQIRVNKEKDTEIAKLKETVSALKPPTTIKVRQPEMRHSVQLPPMTRSFAWPSFT